MNRNEAREYFRDSGLSYDSVTDESIKQLCLLIRKELKVLAETDPENIKMKLKRKPKLKRYINGEKYVSLRCKIRYDSDREAITFNPDGFIGFAGWADDDRVKPFICAFVRWVDVLKERV